MHDSTGFITGVLGTYIDISERKAAEERLHEQEERFRSVVENSGDWIWEIGADDAFTYASPRVKELLGYEPEEVLGRRYYELMPARVAAEIDPVFKQWKAERKPFRSLENAILHKDGHEVVVETSAVPIVGDDGSYKGYRGVDHNIDERKQAVRSLFRVNRALRTLSRGNEAVVRAGSEEDLLNEMCRVVVETGGYRMAWIGIAQHDAEKTIQPVAWAGEEAGYLDEVRVSWDEGPRGNGPSGRAVRLGAPQTVQNIAVDPSMAPWHAEAKQHGFVATAALSLINSTGAFGVLTIFAAEPDAFDTEELSLLQELASDLSYGIRALRDRSEREAAVKRWRASLEAAVAAIAETVEQRDPYTAGHQQRVASLAVAIARELRLSEQLVEGLSLAGVIHDVGKINIPAEILTKPGKLSPLEYQLIKAHPQIGHDILKGIDFPWPIAEMVLQHHERLDGSGYPRGLRGEAMLTEAKILAVADVVEAMMSRRPYREGLGSDAALGEIERGKGRLYDPAAVDACLALFRDKGFELQ